MNQQRAVSIVSALANGVDPMTGEVFDEASPYNHPDVIRALFNLINALPPISELSEQKVLSRPATKEELKQKKNLASGLPKNYGIRWSPEDIEHVITQYKTVGDIELIAQKVERKPGSIIGLLEKQKIISVMEAVAMRGKVEEAEVL